MKTFKQFFESLDAWQEMSSKRIDHSLEQLMSWDRKHDLGLDEWVKSNTPEFDTVAQLAGLMLKGQHEFAFDMASATSDPEGAYRNAAFIAITNFGLGDRAEPEYLYQKNNPETVFYSTRAFVGAEPETRLTMEQIRVRSRLYESIRSSALYKTLWDVIPRWAWQDFDPEQNPLTQEEPSLPPPPT